MLHVLKYEEENINAEKFDPFNKQQGNNNYEYRSARSGNHRHHIGYVAFYDEFGKLCHKEDIEHLKVIAPGQHLYLGKLVADGQTQIEVLPRLATLGTGPDQIESLRANKKTKLFCTDIAY